MTVVFQSAPIFLPAIGLALSPFSSLPIAIAVFFHPSMGIAVLFSSLLILLFISIQEACILLFATGSLGIIIGWLLHKKGIIVSSCISAIILTIGMILLTYLIKIPAFTDFTGSLSIAIIVLIYFAFSFVYALIWNIFLKRVMHHLLNARIFPHD